MAFIAILMFLLYPKEFVEMANESDRGYGAGSAFLIWLPWSVFIDYVSLFKTRLILGFLTRIRSRNATVAIAIVAIDYAVYRLLFSIGLEVVSFGALATQMDLDSWVHFMVEGAVNGSSIGLVHRRSSRHIGVYCVRCDHSRVCRSFSDKHCHVRSMISDRHDASTG
jgi:hypothetical protein